MSDPVVEVETTIAAPSATVWKAMLAGAMFPGTRIQSDWEVGHPITFTGEWQGRAFTDRGEIRSFAEASELSFTHWSDKDGSGSRPPSWHLVSYRLSPSARGTRVSLAQYNEGRDTAIDDNTRAEFEKNWTLMLDGLRQTVEAKPQPSS